MMIEVIAYFRSNKRSERIIKENKCILPISVGQIYHEGEELRAVISLINKKFKSCVFIIADTLQRHTFHLLEPDNSGNLYIEASKKGDLWIDRNERIYSQLDIPYTISRWDAWLSHSEFPLYQRMVEDLYLNNEVFNSAVNLAASSFVSRLFPFADLEYQKVMKCSIEYVKEECAVLPLWVSEGGQYEVYPGRRNPAMEFIYQRYVQENHPNLQRWGHICFKKSIAAGTSTEPVMHS